MNSADLAPEIEHVLAPLLVGLFRADSGELSLTSATVLARLHDGGPQRVTDLAALELVAQPTMTTIVGRLEARGSSSASATAPTGARAVALTPTGRTKLDELRSGRTDFLAGHMAGLGADELSRLAAALPSSTRSWNPPPHERRAPHPPPPAATLVWAVAFACVVAFMGIGLVDPILPTLAHDLQATPSQVSLLFTSYFAMTGLSMLVGGWVVEPHRAAPDAARRPRARRRLQRARGRARARSRIAGFRLGWGLGNALFIATALSVIVGAASGGLASAIVLYEAALGLGIASGPLLGGLLGGISWRGPFFGTATLMAIGVILIVTMLGRVPKPAPGSR